MVAMAAVVGGCFRWGFFADLFLRFGAGLEDHTASACVGRKRHAVVQALGMGGGAGRRVVVGEELASRGYNGAHCWASAYCEMIAARGEGRVGKRSFGANTYASRLWALSGQLEGALEVRGGGFGWQAAATMRLSAGGHGRWFAGGGAKGVCAVQSAAARGFIFCSGSGLCGERESGLLTLVRACRGRGTQAGGFQFL